jgi:hypothetical protein
MQFYPKCRRRTSGLGQWTPVGLFGFASNTTAGAASDVARMKSSPSSDVGATTETSGPTSLYSECFAKLLDLGGSGWDESCEQGEDPAA